MFGYARRGSLVTMSPLLNFANLAAEFWDLNLEASDSNGVNIWLIVIQKRDFVGNGVSRNGF